MNPKTKQILGSVAILLVGIALGFVLDRETAGTAPQGARSPDDEGPVRVRMAAELARRAGVKTLRVTAAPFVPELSLVGTVDFDENRVADIGGRVSGRITRLLVGLGDAVAENQPVAEIEGAELGNAIAEYLSAQANLVAATRQSEREQNLGRQQLTTATAIDDARARAAAYQADVRGAEQRLLAMGVSPGSVRAMTEGRGAASRITLRSPIAGQVVERYAVLGQVVDPTHPILRVADLLVVWVQLDVYERDLARVAEGDTAEIVSDTYPDAVFRGTVSHIEATIDQRTRTARVRIVVPNDDLRLRPGQFVNARLSPQTGARQALTLPPGAILQVDGRPAAFVQVGADTYELRALETGASNRAAIEIRRGLRAGENVVTEGAFALKSELSR